jgi:hypothetical protein
MPFAACPSEIVDAPIELVWNLLTEPADWGEFYDVRNIVVVPVGPAKVGQRVQGVTGPLGLRLPVIFEFLKIDANEHRLVMEVHLPFGIEVHEDLDVRGIDAERCRVNYHCNFDFSKGWRGALTRLILRRELDRGPADSLARLKSAAERRYDERGRPA